MAVAARAVPRSQNEGLCTTMALHTIEKGKLREGQVLSGRDAIWRRVGRLGEVQSGGEENGGGDVGGAARGEARAMVVGGGGVSRHTGNPVGPKNLVSTRCVSELSNEQT